ncbi:hypothetical protein PR003_g8212 [Phytophthora rubi]|uniref:Uncharacterized protein n=1 Tax=Phytophthora rubi TaxID=129364 RepID=A0A6A3N136_9STRA|nr:hypothetical protein PR002_g7942 [Phytophthora rubi]KAE9039209.1 hypothetical protein PR001_g7612 [Phytophthora rubi]KAE9344922.1 hypothetical protein PR003_g8212 [Phytophthora rubi]
MASFRSLGFEKKMMASSSRCFMTALWIRCFSPSTAWISCTSRSRGCRDMTQT